MDVTRFVTKLFKCHGRNLLGKKGQEIDIYYQYIHPPIYYMLYTSSKESCHLIGSTVSRGF